MRKTKKMRETQNDTKGFWKVYQTVLEDLDSPQTDCALYEDVRLDVESENMILDSDGEMSDIMASFLSTIREIGIMGCTLSGKLNAKEREICKTKAIGLIKCLVRDMDSIDSLGTAVYDHMGDDRRFTLNGDTDSPGQTNRL